MKTLTLNASQKMKQTPIGEIPVDWRIAKFGEITRIAEGQVDPTITPYLDYLHIGPENISSDTGHLTGLRTARQLALISGKYLFDEEAIVYSKIRPNLNKVCIPGFKGICSADAYPVWPATASLQRNYLFYFMLSAIFVKQAVEMSMRTGLPKINRGDLNSILVVVPPVQEQQAITAILTRWSSAISQGERLVDAKRQSKAGWMQRLLTGKRRFPTFGKGGKAGSNGWKTYHLGELFDERVEIGRDDLPLLSITGDRGVVDRNDLDKKDTSNADKGKYLRIAPGDIGYNTMRMWQGVSALSELEGIVSPAYTVCTPKADKIDGRFAAYLFKFQPVVHRFWRYSQGMVDDTLNLKFHNFAEVRVKIPSVEEQREIAALLSGCDSEIILLEKELEALREQKKGLMQKLLTGKVRVHRGKEGQ